MLLRTLRRVDTLMSDSSGLGSSSVSSSTDIYQGSGSGTLLGHYSSPGVVRSSDDNGRLVAEWHMDEASGLIVRFELAGPELRRTFLEFAVSRLISVQKENVNVVAQRRVVTRTWEGEESRLWRWSTFTEGKASSGVECVVLQVAHQAPMLVLACLTPWSVDVSRRSTDRTPLRGRSVCLQVLMLRFPEGSTEAFDGLCLQLLRRLFAGSDYMSYASSLPTGSGGLMYLHREEVDVEEHETLRLLNEGYRLLDPRLVNDILAVNLNASILIHMENLANVMLDGGAFPVPLWSEEDEQFPYTLLVSADEISNLSPDRPPMFLASHPDLWLAAGVRLLRTSLSAREVDLETRRHRQALEPSGLSVFWTNPATVPFTDPELVVRWFALEGRPTEADSVRRSVCLCVFRVKRRPETGGTPCFVAVLSVKWRDVSHNDLSDPFFYSPTQEGRAINALEGWGYEEEQTSRSSFGPPDALYDENTPFFSSPAAFAADLWTRLRVHLWKTNGWVQDTSMGAEVPVLFGRGRFVEWYTDGQTIDERRVCMDRLAVLASDPEDNDGGVVFKCMAPRSSPGGGSVHVWWYWSSRRAYGVCLVVYLSGMDIRISASRLHAVRPDDGLFPLNSAGGARLFDAVVSYLIKRDDACWPPSAIVSGLELLSVQLSGLHPNYKLDLLACVGISSPTPTAILYNLGAEGLSIALRAFFGSTAGAVGQWHGGIDGELATNDVLNLFDGSERVPLICDPDRCRAALSSQGHQLNRPINAESDLAHWFVGRTWRCVEQHVALYHYYVAERVHGDELENTLLARVSRWTDGNDEVWACRLSVDSTFVGSEDVSG
jgi:hypothetical protein